MSIVLLCHFDDATRFIDEAGHTLVASSGVAVNVTAPKFGIGSGDFTANAAANINAGTSADFNFGSGPFTVEAWARFTTAPGSGIWGVLTKFGGSSNYSWFFGQVSGALAFYYSATGSDNPNVGATYTPALNTWIHLAADRDASNVLRVYANGVVVASATVSATLFASTRSCLIGNDENLNRNFPGQLDEVRIINGAAQYGGAFTPPIAPFVMPPTYFSARHV